jgi:hypothetical protein
VPLTLERVLIFALAIGLAGLGGTIWCVVQWADKGFGPLQLGVMIKVLTVSITGIALALQLAFTAFLSAIIEIEIYEPSVGYKPFGAAPGLSRASGHLSEHSSLCITLGRSLAR